MFPSALTKSSNPTYCCDDYAKELKELRATNRIAREHIKLTIKQQYDKNTNYLI